MTLAQVKAFLMVLERGNFSHAALELGLAQASVSQAIAELERELGVKLFSRGRNGATPTEAGVRLAPHARHMLQAEESLRQEVGVLNGDLSGVLRVATFQSIARYLMPLAITKLRDTHPALTLRLVEIPYGVQGITDAIISGEADVGFTNWTIPEELIGWKLIEDPYMVLLPARYSGKGNIRWEDLRDEPLIALEAEKRDGCMFGTLYYQEHYGTCEPAYIVRETSTVLSFVAQGLGFSILPRMSVEPLPPSVVVAPLSIPQCRIISVEILPESLKTPAVRAFLMTLKALLPESEVPELSLKRPSQVA